MEADFSNSSEHTSDNSSLDMSLPLKQDKATADGGGLSQLNDDSSAASQAEPKQEYEYKAISYHWFHTLLQDGKKVWSPMSHKDSATLERVYLKNKEKIDEYRKEYRATGVSAGLADDNYIVPIKGGRFQVSLIEMKTTPIYWKVSDDSKLSDVKRCLWFYKENNEQFYEPYDEEYCLFLEKEYENTLKNSTFHKRIDFVRQKSEDTEAFVFHSPVVMLHFNQGSHQLDEFGNLSSDAERPRVIKRGLDQVISDCGAAGSKFTSSSIIEPDEQDRIDHVCFVVHGIGPGCDLKFRPLIECVDDLRDISRQMIDFNLRKHMEEKGLSGRVEFIPVTWHEELHRDQNGVDIRMTPLTLPSIPKLREYSNSTILDVLFYTSPIYCQRIISRVGNELNRLLKLFLERNPYFGGKISLIGHSLGSLILFDLLSHQQVQDSSQDTTDAITKSSSDTDLLNEDLHSFLSRLELLEYELLFNKEKITMSSLLLLGEKDLIELGIPMGPRKLIVNEISSILCKRERWEVESKVKANLKGSSSEAKFDPSMDYFKFGLAGTGQPLIKYPQLNFKPATFFALGSPVPMFLTVRGIESLGADYKLPTCDGYFNIFHPFDPVAYRLEPLVFSSPLLKPVLVPHHKGRKRLHLELKESLTKVEDLRQKMYDQISSQIKNAWTSISEFAKLPKIAGNLTPPSITNASAPMTVVKEIQEEMVIDELIEDDDQFKSIELNDETKSEAAPTTSTTTDTLLNTKIDMGRLNRGRRIDYALQERPIESFNEYLFAVATHACYWFSEDTILLMIKEMYDIDDIHFAAELQLSEQQAKPSTSPSATSSFQSMFESQAQNSWLTWNSNIQKTFSYFNLGFPKSISSVLTTNKPTTDNQEGATRNQTSNESKSDKKDNAKP